MCIGFRVYTPEAEARHAAASPGTSSLWVVQKPGGCGVDLSHGGSVSSSDRRRTSRCLFSNQRAPGTCFCRATISFSERESTWSACSRSGFHR